MNRESSNLALNPESTPAGRLPLPLLVLRASSVEHCYLLVIAIKI